MRIVMSAELRSPYPLLSIVRRHTGLLVLPLLFVVVEVHFRSVAGPFWQWNLLDPAYFYLLDSLNVIAGAPPGHIAHPGITVDSFGAAVLALSEMGIGGDELVDKVLRDPELFLMRLSTAYVVFNAAVLLIVGYVAHWVFGAITPAIACQIAPFMSSIILKHGFLPKPEAMVITVTLALLIASVVALRSTNSLKMAMAFGVIAGFGLATKITMAPVFALPLFLLPNIRCMLIYAVMSIAAFFIFFLPGIDALGDFAGWVVHVAKGSGAHGAGPQTFIDTDYYPKAVVKILKRPALKVPMALAVVTLAIAFWRRPRRDIVANMEVRALFGILVTQALHVLFVAKQPTAFYLIPSYMLSAFSVLLSLRLLWQLKPERWQMPVSGSHIGGALLAIFVVAQVATLQRLEDHFTRHNISAMSITDRTFDRCARIYIYAASSPVFALFLADRVTGSRHSQILAKYYGGANYWIEDWFDQSKLEFRNWQGRQDFDTVRQSFPCLVFRGNRKASLIGFLKSAAPGMSYSTKCSAAPEMIATVNVACDGGGLK